MKTFYFAHQTVNRHEARELELKIEEATGLVLDNPFYGGEAKEVKSLDSTGTSDMNPFEIEKGDLNKVKKADGVVSYLGVDVLALGTCFEIWEAIRLLHKPVYVISPVIYRQYPRHNHPFLIANSVPVFENVYAFIKYVNDNPKEFV